MAFQALSLSLSLSPATGFHSPRHLRLLVPRLRTVGTLIFITTFFHSPQPVLSRVADNNNYSLVQL